MALRCTRPATTAGVLLALIATGAAGDPALEKLKPAQRVAGFEVDCLYADDAGRAMGGRFRHIGSGFVLDLLRIQSVPQAFIWVNSPPPSDQGEPHTLEHLLLGKGTRGRAVASLEEMALGMSSAFTQQLRTCYHFHTPSGPEVFYQLLEAKLAAMLHPNYSDEEIRREVCNLGIAVDAADGSLRLEEKGTVYNEMVSSFERPWSTAWRELGRLWYGPRHPLALDSGGFPDSIRTMTPDDLRRFHAATHHLSNMGMIVAVPDAMKLEESLSKVDAIFRRLEPDAKPGPDAARADERLPQPQPAPFGAIMRTEFPHQNPDEPGNVAIAWPAVLKLDNQDATLLSLLVDNLASGTTSDLYRALIDSQTRLMDIGARSVFGFASEDPGNPVMVGISGVRREFLEPEKLESLRALVVKEIEKVAGFGDGSQELRAYNQRILNRVIERRRDGRQFLNSPPGFGFRGVGSEWMDRLKHLQNTEGFRKSISLKGEYEAIEQLLAEPGNIWKGAIERWKLLENPPHAIASVANPDLIASTEAARAERMARATDELMQRFGVTDETEAIQRFKAEYDAATEQIDAAARTIKMPRFVDRPPMTLDDQLAFEVLEMPGARPLVASKFENITGATIGLAFRMDRVPAANLIYLPALPALLTEVGAVRDGELLSYDAMREAIRREILDLHASYSVSYRTGRVELLVRATGTDEVESQRALDWMEAVLFHAHWEAENLPRIRDAIDVALRNTRNVMRGREESWVTDPANAYWRQDQPLLLLADCFLTQEHALQRLRWRLMDPGTKRTQAQLAGFMAQLAAAGGSLDRAGLGALAAGLMDPSALVDSLPAAGRSLLAAAAGLEEEARAIARKAAEDLQLCLAGLPEGTLASDWRHICTEMAADLAVPPERTLEEIRATLEAVRHQDNVRGFLVASTQEQKRVKPRVDALVLRLNPAASRASAYPRTALVVRRLQDRLPNIESPRFVGLVNENTRAGVVINSAPCASYRDTDQEALLRFVAARLYGGGGAHSMFMKTWGAGLAYSNGLRSNEATGRLVYYAERCPDLAQTVDFVVKELKNAPRDPSLAEYALAQAFTVYRSGSRYEQRGEAMAADLADGVTPEVVRHFREEVLRLRKDPGLYEKLHERMSPAYGEVLPGYGPTMDECPPETISFIIGPEKQFASYESYVRKSEGDVSIVRLYPRDYWYVDGEVN